MKDIHKDFDIFSRALIVSSDCDPVYPFVKDLIKIKHYEPAWFVFVYVAFYSLESAIKMCNEFPTSGDWNEKKFLEMRASKYISKFGHERRGTVRNVKNQLSLFRGVLDFLDVFDNLDSKIGGYELNNKTFRNHLQTYPFHGGWSAYKIAELFEKSLGYDELSIHDLGLQGRDPNRDDSPIGGLRWLYGRENVYDESFFPIWNRFGENLAKSWGTGIGEVETCLCKFHKLCTGKYFVGHDIQEFVELEHVLGKNTYQIIMKANYHPVFWTGKKHLEKEKKGIYMKNSKVLYEDFAKKLPKANVLNILLNTE